MKRINPNNRAASHDKREMETVQCCGQWYRRWRFAGVVLADGHRKRSSRWSGNHAKRCVKCGELLPWMINYEKPKTSASRRYWQRKSLRNLQLGLRTNGKPFVRVLLSKEESLQRRRERWLRLSHRRIAAGLTSRGTVRKKQNRRAREQAWRTLRNEMQLPVASWDLADAERAAA